MRSFEQFLKVSGWTSKYDSVQRLLDHLQRKTRSESSRLRYLETVYHLCAACEMSPAELVATKKAKLEGLAQSFLDKMRRENKSVRYINVTLAQLVTFFRVNGFKNGKELELNRYTQPARYRKVPEYIPISQEIERMANYAGSPKARALILATYVSGLRNSTVRAVLYGDVKAELEGGNDVVHVPVYPEMKRTDANAAKNSLPYSTFLCKEAVEAVKAYIDDYNHKHPDTPLREDEPLFEGQIRGRPIKMRTLQVLVKGAARKSGIKRWKDVTPHALRKAFENAIRNSGLDYKDQLFLEGHVLPGSEDPYIDKTRVEEFRQKYATVTFLPAALSGDRVRRQTMLDTLKLLSSLGIKPELTDAIRREVEQAPDEEALESIMKKAVKIEEVFGHADIFGPTLAETPRTRGKILKKAMDGDAVVRPQKTWPTGPKKPAKWFCIECGRELKEGAKFCGNCGTTTG